MRPSLALAFVAAMSVVAALALRPAAVPAVDAQSAPPARAPVPLAAPNAPEPSPAAPAPAHGAYREACNWRAGRQLAYRVSSDSTAPLMLPGRESTFVDARLAARLRLRILRVEGEEAVAVGRFDEVRAQLAGVAADELTDPFLVTLGPDCRLRRFARGVDVPRDAARNVQGLVWSALFSTAPGRLVAQDGLGTFAAEMAPRPDGRLERTVRAYSRLWGSTSTDVPATGLSVITLGDGPWFERLETRTTLTVDGARTASHTQLYRAVAEALELPVREDAFVWEDLLGAVVRERVVRPNNKYDAARRERVRPQTLEVAMTAFAERCASEGGAQDTWPDLSAWFEVHPDGVAKAVAQLHAGEVPPDAIAWLYTALGKARVPQARDALLAIRRDATEPPMDRVRATFNLLDRDDVGVPLARELSSEGTASLQDLEHKENFLRGESLLALGMMAGLRADPAIEAVARETLTTIVRSAPPDSQIMRSALKAIGNTGDPTLLAEAAPAMSADGYHTRRAAAHVFRRMPPKDSEAVALAWLRREHNPFVKRELYTQIRRQHFDAQVPPSAELTRQALADLPQTQAPIDRKDLIRFLALSTLIRSPELRAALVAQAKLERQRDTGILNVFTEILTPAEVTEVLQ